MQLNRSLRLSSTLPWNPSRSRFPIHEAGSKMLGRGERESGRLQVQLHWHAGVWCECGLRRNFSEISHCST